MTIVDDVNIAVNSEIDSAELAQRVAVLKRFKTLLSQQRDRFRSYLDLLDKQQNVIESGSAEDLLTYVEIEEKIVADIFSIQKVIDPLEEMYYTVISGQSPVDIPVKHENSDEVSGLKASLDKLKSEAVIRSTKNKELLSKRMLELRQEIKTLRNNPYAARGRRSSFGDANTASLVDIHG
ncbi:MAG: flagellar export chaperone FlgN [Treponema sp.]|nr:flagellar export chaperone FlgN [Treponema sp.]